MSDKESQRLDAVRSTFEAVGGQFVAPPEKIARAVENCRGVVFDWDGVFNFGRKGASVDSGFSEADSMGTNMLRYGLWRKGQNLPLTAIMSGADNKSAVHFARRECFTSVYLGVKDKRKTIEHLAAENDIELRELMCVFDDINDLGMAELCGLRFMVRRDASPLLLDYAVKHSLCDYVTGSSEFAVREVCELVLGLLGIYGDVLQSRIAVDGEYQRYFNSRQAVSTQSL